MCGVPTPLIGPVQKVCAVSPPPISTLFRKYVRCPPSWYTLFLCRVPPTFSSVPWTLWLCLRFWAKSRIWQVPACKMKPSSTCILDCGTPSWACILFLTQCLQMYPVWSFHFLSCTGAWQRASLCLYKFSKSHPDKNTFLLCDNKSIFEYWRYGDIYSVGGAITEIILLQIKSFSVYIHGGKFINIQSSKNWGMWFRGLCD